VVHQVLSFSNLIYGVYSEGNIFNLDDIHLYSEECWEPTFISSHLKNVSCARIYCQGKSFVEIAKEMNKEDYFKSLENKMKIFIKACIKTSVPLNDVSIFYFIPEKFLNEYYGFKESLIKYVLETYKRPSNHEFMVDLYEFANDLKKVDIEINKNILKEYYGTDFGKNFLTKINRNKQTKIIYNLYGTKTGRLSESCDSFPILSMRKELRKAISPKNDIIIEYDYNAAELRTFLGLSDNKNRQPEYDLHQWNIDNIIKSDIKREESKKIIFKYLYSDFIPPEIKDICKLKLFYNKSKILKKYALNDKDGIKTIYDREINCEQNLRMSYIIQSTFSDLFLRKVVEIFKFLKDKKSKICYTIHDSICIDWNNEERKKYEKEVVSILESTILGQFKVSIR
jgi:hypothetical protein